MIDFEEDVPDNDAQRLQHKVQDIAQGIQQALDTASRGRLLKDGLQVSSPQPLLLHTPSLYLHSFTLDCTLSFWPTSRIYFANVASVAGLCHVLDTLATWPMSCMSVVVRGVGSAGGAAECGQEQPAECMEWHGQGHRHSGGGHHPRHCPGR